ncbi:hypothetical protein DID88_008134 [Monilinia fructigena]|uniref:Uncharacterized protein n=1 Tax=Monilinia fructigena TaxID=38457 RepID=A0A395J5F8_9HELO|nr:hypothetical protein DID88_008134 [Monilinia fructigena]
MKPQGISTITTASGILEEMAPPSEVVWPQSGSDVKNNPPVDTPENENRKVHGLEGGEAGMAHHDRPSNCFPDGVYRCYYSGSSASRSCL